MNLSLNDYLLVFIIVTSGLLLLFPKALSGGVRMINVKKAVLLMNREACTIIDALQKGKKDKLRFYHFNILSRKTIPSVVDTNLIAQAFRNVTNKGS